MKLLQILFLTAALSSCAAPAFAKVSGPAAFLQKIDRQLCTNFKSLKCHRKKHVAVKPKAKFEKQLAAPISVPEQFPPEPMIELKPPPQNKVASIIPRTKPPASPTPPVPLNTSCLAALQAKQTEYEPVIQPAGMSSCNVTEPVQLKSAMVKGVSLEFPDHPILNCAFALQFVSWLQELGAPAATAKEGFAITKFYTGPGYVCRGRNGDSSGKISEHGFGNAVDVERLTFSDGQTFAVHDAPDPTSKAYETLKAIRAAACTRFTTVLGPGSNDAHREHFHFDLGTHGKSGTYKICE